TGASQPPRQVGSPHASAARSFIGGEPVETSLDTTLFFVIFLTATFAASLVAGLAGFAFGLVAAAMWLYILTPLQTATLIIWFGLIAQGYAVWKLRHAIQWRRLAPLVIGAAIGVPLGVYVLATASPRV